MNFTIEPMIDIDAAEVMRIYGEGIAGSNATFETVAPDFETWIAGKRPDCRLVARKADGLLAGWAVLSPTSKRKVYEGVCEVTIYVSDDAQGMGVGKALMQTLIDESEAAGIWTLYSSLFPENSASVKLHERYGFRVIGRREKIAFHPTTRSWRDTLILERRSKTVGQ
ncbi:MAG: L-amino acid N-acyltransferase YncA [Cellvibrionaceae bacterium]|jgi:L-amino acid N-acyltransferase YncA